jgi:glutaminyl-peptide cyclotransferase
MRLTLFLIIAVFIFGGCNSGEEEEAVPESTGPVTPAIQFKEIDYFLHDTALFTEGLLVHDGQLYESTGSPDANRKSLIGINDLKTGNFIQKVALTNKELFGEGIVFLKDKLYQLTYKNHLGFIYDAKTFKQTGQFAIPKEGWGLTTDGSNIIMSDGTDTLTFLHPDDLKPLKKLPVTENGKRRDSLNELEYIKGYIYANIWLTNHIVKINPADGKVVGELDLSPLAFKASLTRDGGDVLNGIAYDSTTDMVFVTGKLWPHVYQIQLR